MPVTTGMYQQHAPSCWDRMKFGFMVGFSVGVASGIIFGGYSAYRYGLRGKELINNMGKTMLQGGGTFGTFMAIGTGIRC
ncbi:Reactive oxygen species modulator 1 [Anthophora retusa]